MIPFYKTELCPGKVNEYLRSLREKGIKFIFLPLKKGLFYAPEVKYI